MTRTVIVQIAFIERLAQWVAQIDGEVWAFGSSQESAFESARTNYLGYEEVDASQLQFALLVISPAEIEQHHLDLIPTELTRMWRIARSTTQGQKVE